MNGLEKVLASIAAWARAFASSTRHTVVDILAAIRSRALAVARAVTRAYRALESSVAHVVVESVEFILSLRYALLILLFPIATAWAAIRLRSTALWILSALAALIIVRGALLAPRHLDETAKPILGVWIRGAIANATRWILRLWFAAATVFGLWHTRHRWLPQSAVEPLDKTQLRLWPSKTISSPAPPSAPRTSSVIPPIPMSAPSTDDTALPWVTSLQGVYYYPNTESCPAVKNAANRANLRYFRTEQAAREYGRVRAPVC